MRAVVGVFELLLFSSALAVFWLLSRSLEVTLGLGAIAVLFNKFLNRT